MSSSGIKHLNVIHAVIINNFIEGKYDDPNKVDNNTSNYHNKPELIQAVKYFANNGRYRTSLAWFQNDKEMAKKYDRLDDYLLGFMNFWSHQRSYAYSPMYVKGALAQESKIGNVSGKNGDRDVAQALYEWDPNVYLLGKVGPDAYHRNPPAGSGHEPVAYNPTEGTVDGDDGHQGPRIPKDGFKVVRNLFKITGTHKFDKKNDVITGELIPELVTPMLSLLCMTLVMGYKNIIAKNDANDLFQLEAGLKAYNRAYGLSEKPEDVKDGDKNYLYNIRSVLQNKDQVDGTITPLDSNALKYHVVCRDNAKGKPKITLPALSKFGQKNTFEKRAKAGNPIYLNDEASLIQNVLMPIDYYTEWDSYVIKAADNNLYMYIGSKQVDWAFEGNVSSTIGSINPNPFHIVQANNKEITLYFKKIIGPRTQQ